MEILTGAKPSSNPEPDFEPYGSSRAMIIISSLPCNRNYALEAHHGRFYQITLNPEKEGKEFLDVRVKAGWFLSQLQNRSSAYDGLLQHF
jgi:hypothetical protein